MKEGEEQRAYLVEGVTEYYEFPIAIEDLTIVKVEFSIFAISGSIEVLSSRMNPHPSEKDN